MTRRPPSLRLRRVADRDEALRLAPLLDRCAAEATAEFRDAPLPDEVGRAFLERHLDAPETVLVLAEGAGDEVRGLCVTAPLEDPLTLERTPLVVLLHVQAAERHRGLAARLVEEARAALAERGLHALAARAGHNDDALISMGERWGFVRLWELMLREA